MLDTAVICIQVNELIPWLCHHIWNRIFMSLYVLLCIVNRGRIFLVFCQIIWKLDYFFSYTHTFVHYKLKTRDFFAAQQGQDSEMVTLIFAKAAVFQLKISHWAIRIIWSCQKICSGSLKSGLAKLSHSELEMTKNIQDDN